MAKRPAPAFLVCEIKVEKPRPWDEDRTDREIRQWYTLTNRKDVDDLKDAFERPGFGSDYRSVRYEVHRIVTTEPYAAADVPPLTVKDHALRLAPYDSNGCTRLGPGLRVDVRLRGRGCDPKGVFWSPEHNSFAVVLPREGERADARLTSEQGVMLLSVNGHGEIRWDVDPRSAGMPENREAVEHFGLTWSEVPAAAAK